MRYFIVFQKKSDGKGKTKKRRNIYRGHQFISDWIFHSCNFFRQSIFMDVFFSNVIICHLSLFRIFLMFLEKYCECFAFFLFVRFLWNLYAKGFSYCFWAIVFGGLWWKTKEREESMKWRSAEKKLYLWCYKIRWGKFRREAYRISYLLENSNSSSWKEQLTGECFFQRNLFDGLFFDYTICEVLK